MTLRAGFLVATLAYCQTRLTFEVASIKLNETGERAGFVKPLPGGQTYEAKNFSVKGIFGLMYRVPDWQISGGPKWLETDRYDIMAKAAQPTNIDELHVMFQNLLADEFKLTFHKESKQGPVYVLSVDKFGSKIKVNESARNFDIPIRGGRGGELTGTRVPMPYFCWFLSQILAREERPVIDKTGLDKVYDFTLSFAPDLPPGVDRDRLPPGLMDRPNLFNALKEQLGLKLEPQKGPVEMYVIDGAERPSAK